MKRIALVSISAALCLAAYAAPVISDKDIQRADQLVKQMTLEEKCLLIAGQIDGFHTAPIERLGIPSVRMADGPQGVRNNTRSTYYPCGISLAASFNPRIANGVGTGIGLDARARGVGIMLCPGVNIYRSALCGRNFEYYGEDPFLASTTAVEYIRGIQELGVMATIKHFCMNNQEYDRHGVSSNVDERTMNEIYLPTFRNAVQKGNVAAVMTSYNPVNGVHAAENDDLIKGCLRAWGFNGIVMSDWTSTYSTIGCLLGGLDLEMPMGYVLNYKAIKPLVDNAVVNESVIDEKCRHILQAFSAYGFLDKYEADTSIPEDYEVSREYAYKAAVEGPVLLKNNALLPLKGGNIVVLGPNADRVVFGGGSGRIDAPEGRNISLYQGLCNLGRKWKVTLLDWKNPDETALKKASAVIFAAGFDKDSEKEGADREYDLPDGQNEAISAVAALNPRTLVVANSGGEFNVNPWIDKVAGLIMAWYSGQEGGNALAAIISGKVSPSGKLPFTFWGELDRNPTSPYYHINMDKETGNGDAASSKRHIKRFSKYPFTQYTEGIFVGYRGVGKFNVNPMFPFGFGLSYSSFKYDGLSCNVLPGNEGVKVSFKLSNTGKMDASEAVQLYVKPLNPSVVRPVKELKAFDKVFVPKGKSVDVEMQLGPEAFSYYDAGKHDWVVDPVDYEIVIGSSSVDEVLSEKISL